MYILKHCALSFLDKKLGSYQKYVINSQWDLHFIWAIRSSADIKSTLDDWNINYTEKKIAFEGMPKAQRDHQPWREGTDTSMVREVFIKRAI